MFYTTMHSEHFIDGYMPLDMVKDHSDNEKVNLLVPLYELLFLKLIGFTYTQFHEKTSAFFSNIIGLPERRNKRKNVLEITKMYYFFI